MLWSCVIVGARARFASFRIYSGVWYLVCKVIATVRIILAYISCFRVSHATESIRHTRMKCIEGLWPRECVVEVVSQPRIERYTYIHAKKGKNERKKKYFEHLLSWYFFMTSCFLFSFHFLFWKIEEKVSVKKREEK